MERTERFSTRHELSGQHDCFYTVLRLEQVQYPPRFLDKLMALMVNLSLYMHATFLTTGKLIEIEHQSSLHTTMRPGWEDLVRRCLQMFLHHSEGQPWSCKRHYQEGKYKTVTAYHPLQSKYFVY